MRKALYTGIAFLAITGSALAQDKKDFNLDEVVLWRQDKMCRIARIIYDRGLKAAEIGDLESAKIDYQKASMFCPENPIYKDKAKNRQDYIKD